MQKINRIILQGEKIGLERYISKDNKPVVNLHLLNGFEAIKLSVRDTDLAKSLENVPDREMIMIMAEVAAHKDNLYLQALALLD